MPRSKLKSIYLLKIKCFDVSLLGEFSTSILLDTIDPPIYNYSIRY